MDITLKPEPETPLFYSRIAACGRQTEQVLQDAPSLLAGGSSRKVLGKKQL